MPQAELRFESPAVVSPPIGAYSHIAVVPDGRTLLFLSGQFGSTPEGSLPAGGEEQYANALRNVVALLESQGGSPRDLVKLTTYLVTPLDLDAVRRIRQEVLGDVRPAATLIYVPRLATPEHLVEVEATAAIPHAR